MTTLPWLADALRAAGLTVVEHPGWKTHGRPGSYDPSYGVVHATAAPRSQSDEIQVRVVRDGRSDLPGPIANAAVDRRGVWHVLAAGRCNSTLTGTAGPFAGLGNTYALSVEGCNDNLSEPWPDVQYRSYVAGWAAWCRHLGWPASRLVGHKEHTPGHKTDPTFNMAVFRADVARVLAGTGDDDMTPDELLRADVLPDTPGRQYTVGGAIHTTLGRTGAIAQAQAAQTAALETLVSKVDALAASGDADVLAAIDARHADAMQRLTDMESREVARDIEQVAALKAALPTGSGPVSRADLEAALRAVYGAAFASTPDTQA